MIAEKTRFILRSVAKQEMVVNGNTLLLFYLESIIHEPDCLALLFAGSVCHSILLCKYHYIYSFLHSTDSLVSVANSENYYINN